jgi:hypothetical protein
MAPLRSVASRRDFLLRSTGLALALAGSGCAGLPGARERAAANVVPPFSLANGALLPPPWAPHVMRRDLPTTDYRLVTLEGRPVLHARGAGGSSGLRCAVEADVHRTPWLRWQWRVDEVPLGMSVADNYTDDSPARVVVAFDGDLSTLSPRERAFYELVELVTGHRLPFATLMYVWDGELPVGQIVPYARSRRIQYAVVESGAARRGRWLAYERNLVQDFQRVFGEPPPGRVSSVGVFTDSDDLKVEVNAWYGDIGLYA